MKGGGKLLALVLALCGCTTAQYTSNNQKLSDEKYGKLVEIIKKQKERENNIFQKVEETNLENKTEQTNSKIIHSDIYDFLRLNYGQHTIDALSLSNKYEEIMTSLASIPNFQETIPALMDGLKRQVERSYRGSLREEVPSADAQLALLSLIPSIQNNSELIDLIVKLQSKGVYLDVTPSKESPQPVYILPNVFLRIEDWQKCNGEKQILEFSAQQFLEGIILRPDLKNFADRPEELDKKLESWLSRRTHYIQSLGGFFEDSYESWENYKNLDLVQKLQLYTFMFSLNWGDLRREITDLLDIDFMLDYTEVGGALVLSEGYFCFKQIDSANQRVYPEENVPIMRIAGLSQDLTESQRVQIYERKEWLTEEQAAQLTEKQVELLLEKYAENKNSGLNNRYKPETALNGVGNFHFHAQEIDSSKWACPSGWITENIFNSKGLPNINYNSDLGAAAIYLDYQGKHYMNVLITSIDKNTFDVNLYYACGTNSKPVNVSVGAYERVCGR